MPPTQADHCSVTDNNKKRNSKHSFGKYQNLSKTVSSQCRTRPAHHCSFLERFVLFLEADYQLQSTSSCIHTWKSEESCRIVNQANRLNIRTSFLDFAAGKHPSVLLPCFFMYRIKNRLGKHPSVLLPCFFFCTGQISKNGNRYFLP